MTHASSTQSTPVRHMSVPLASAIQPSIRMGLLVLATDPTTEAAFRSMTAGLPIGLHVNRVAFESPATVSALRAMTADVARAARDVLPEHELQVLGFQCVSGTLAISPEEVLSQLRSARPRTTCTTTFHAVSAALERLSARRISLITPYIDDVTLLVCDGFRQRGISVLSAASFPLNSDFDMGRVAPHDIARTVVQACHPQSDAVYVSCGALNATPVIEELEHHLGIPVITSNQALCWHMLRIAGCRDVMDGFGILMRTGLTHH